MSTPQHQLSSLTDAVNRLLDAHAVLKERNHELQQRLEAAEDALTKARHENSELHNLSTPTPRGGVQIGQRFFCDPANDGLQHVATGTRQHLA